MGTHPANSQQETGKQAIEKQGDFLLVFPQEINQAIWLAFDYFEVW